MANPYDGLEPIPEAFGSWAPRLKMPTSAPLKHPGSLAPLYGPIDSYVEGVGKGLSEAEADVAKAGGNTGSAARGSLLANMLLTGAPALASSALKAASAPIDMVRGREVDFSLVDAANMLLGAVGGRAVRGKREAPAMAPEPQYNPGAHKPYYEPLPPYVPPPAAPPQPVPPPPHGWRRLDLAPQIKELPRIPVDMPARGYRGGSSGEHRFKTREDRGPWASDNPQVANTYANVYGPGDRANVMPMQFEFKNPLVIGADQKAPYSWDAVPIGGRLASTEGVSIAARQLGHDGVVFKNIIDTGTGDEIPSTVYHALQRGTVRSPLTGELIYSLPAAGVAGGAGVNALLRQYRGD